MYKEMVERRKAPAMVLLFVVLITFICLSDILPRMNIGIISIKAIAKMFFTTLMIALCYIEFSRCKVKYKYSIVADQFIIHKIRGHEVTILEDIKLKNIDFIGKVENYKADIHISDSKKYSCSTFFSSKFCCIYKVEGKFKKFYFEPSEGLINKIRLLKGNPVL
ncbi:hypothetical protein LGK97_15930 [Clostridium sp. CS001]|uniref:hypothetical protein n=1 Tax=Clostridium sp. CS001 TaxID=2880648 RepID=UPI001CF3901E|nr:hypothetical protein [Clostridium sp. CS001]MCB2291217.1 hypothetical protein [Clostridium sp. CS001]